MPSHPYPPRMQSAHLVRIQLTLTPPRRHPCPPWNSHAQPMKNHRSLSTSSPHFKKQTKLRRDFFNWLQGPGAVFKQPPELYTTNYLGQYELFSGQLKENARGIKVPYPQNPTFVSTPVVSDDLANEVYRRIAGGKSVRMVSAGLGVSLQRVAAIYRLKSLEHEWIDKGIPTKPFLTKALHSMLPTTQFKSTIRDAAGNIESTSMAQHEPINDLPTYQQTHVQLFIPVAESRSFTRKDAGDAFGIPSADEMIPHPELVEVEKDFQDHVDVRDIRARAQEREQLEIKEKEEGENERKKIQAEKEIVQEVGRWAWRLQDVKTGAVGYRYGVPHEDRKRGIVKIPTRVE